MRDRVVFKIWEGEVIALLPDATVNPGMVMSYMHIGQHGEADAEFMDSLPMAKYEQYVDLLEELKSIGYKLHVMDSVPLKLF